MRNLLKDRPDLTRVQLERTRRLMDEHGGDCLVTRHEKHIPKLTLPDLDDRHVLAAAIECQADAIVTWNQADFPKKIVAVHGIKVCTPDELIGTLLDTHSTLLLAAMKNHRASLKNPAKSPQQYLETLTQQGLQESVKRLQAETKRL